MAQIDVDEVIAVTMGPESAVRALHKAVSLGADRSVHLTDEALAGSDVNGTGYSLAQVLAKESPDLVLLGQQSDDGECYTIGAVVADHLQMPSLTQVIKIDVEDGKLRCERQAEYGYDTVLVELPAVISVGDAINEPRYPSLKAIMGAKKKPLESVGAADPRRSRKRRAERAGHLREQGVEFAESNADPKNQPRRSSNQRGDRPTPIVIALTERVLSAPAALVRQPPREPVDERLLREVCGLAREQRAQHPDRRDRPRFSAHLRIHRFRLLRIRWQHFATLRGASKNVRLDGA